MKLRDRLFRLFIFDWSGTISDDKRAVYETNLSIWKDLGIPAISFDEFFSKASGTLENLYLFR